MADSDLEIMKLKVFDKQKKANNENYSFLAVVVHSCNPSTKEAEASLIFRKSFRTAKATQRNSVSKSSNNKNLYTLLTVYLCQANSPLKYITPLVLR